MLTTGGLGHDQSFCVNELSKGRGPPLRVAASTERFEIAGAVGGKMRDRCDVRAD